MNAAQREEPSCPAVVEAEDLRQAEAKARALGWTVTKGGDFCGQHKEAA